MAASIWTAEKRGPVAVTRDRLIHFHKYLEGSGEDEEEDAPRKRRRKTAGEPGQYAGARATGSYAAVPAESFIAQDKWETYLDSIGL